MLAVYIMLRALQLYQLLTLDIRYQPKHMQPVSQAVLI